jgi:NAD(P)-dependent dehydrogenase (short-subunit alcohol dehydrogenase family)
MQLELEGKRALVTGSSSGIGRSIALHLAAEGVEVVVHGRDEARANKTADAITQAGGRACVVLGDLMDPEQAKGAVESVRALGGVDILVNNAGGRHGGWERNGWIGAGGDNWIATYRQNVISTVTLIEGLAPIMIDRGWGRVLQIASAIAIHQPPNFPDYQAAKAAEINMTRSLSRGLAGTGVTANCISAGIIHTPGSAAELAAIAAEMRLEGGWQAHERHIAVEVFRQTAGRIGRPEDIAAAVCYLASPRADFVTGVNLVIDGGIN